MVYGELYTFPNWNALKRLDQLEGFHQGYGSNLYDRALVSAEIISSGEVKNTWIYLAPYHRNLSEYDKIGSGEWSRNHQEYLF